jgi:hypothetical protein
MPAAGMSPQPWHKKQSKWTTRTLKNAVAAVAAASRLSDEDDEDSTTEQEITISEEVTMPSKEGDNESESDTAPRNYTTGAKEIPSLVETFNDYTTMLFGCRAIHTRSSQSNISTFKLTYQGIEPQTISTARHNYKVYIHSNTLP